MENSLLFSMGVDPGIILIALIAVTGISLIVTIICFLQYKKLYRRYDMFMRGKDAETLEDTLLDLMDEASYLRFTPFRKSKRVKSHIYRLGYCGNSVCKRAVKVKYQCFYVRTHRVILSQSIKYKIL